MYSLKVLKHNGVLNRAGRALDVMAGIYKMMHRPEWHHEHKHAGKFEPNFSFRIRLK